MLRELSMALGLSMSLNALGSTVVQDAVLTKSPDGKVLKCEENADVNRPGYKPTLFFVVPKNDGIEISVSLAAMTCRLNAAHDGYEFTVRKMNDPMPSMALQGLPATLVFDHQDVLLISRALDVLGSREAANEMIQAFTYDLSLDQVLTARELRRLDRGEPVHVIQTLLVRTASHVESSYGRSDVQAGAGGSYIIEFTLEKVDSALRVSQQVLR